MRARKAGSMSTRTDSYLAGLIGESGLLSGVGEALVAADGLVHATPVGQAADAFRLVTGVDPDAARRRQHFLSMLEQGLEKSGPLGKDLP